jgi:hypothetical protein
MRRLTPVLFGLFAAACNGRDSRDAGDPTRSLIRVQVSYTHAVGTPATELRYESQAQFVRYRSLDPAGVPTLLGFADYDSIPLDGCRASDGATELDVALGDPTRVPAEVALLDAGRVELRGAVDRSPMRVAHYPELVPFVAGVVYGTDENRPLTLSLGQPVQVVGEGGEEVGPFSASVMTPRSLPQLSVETLRRGSDLDVRWTTEESTEPLFLEAKWAVRGQKEIMSGGARVVRCRVRDDGEFTMPREALDGLPAPTLISSATLTAARLSRAPVQAPGAGHGELIVELRDVVPLQVAP